MQPQRPMIVRRTESDMLSMAPIKLRLGMKDFTVPVLNNRKAAAWREQLFAALAPLVAGFDFSGFDLNTAQQQVSAAMATKLSQELIAYPQRLAELLIAFSPDNLKSEDLEEATDEQICLAFSQVAEVGYPFFFHLWATKRAMATPMQKIADQVASRVV